MRTTRIVLPFCVALTCVLAGGASPARADSAADDATGIALFNDGKRLAGLSDWEHACPKFAEAERLHPAAAILLNLADCYEHLGKLASAWGAWNDAEIMARHAGDAERELLAAQRGAALVPQLATLTIVVPPATRVPGLEVRKDGALVGEAQWGSSLPADVAAHTIEASAPGHKAWSTVVRVETNGSAASVEIPALDVLIGPAPQHETPAPFWVPQRVAGVTVGALGVVMLAIATGLGVAAIQDNNASKAQCLPNAPNMCLPAGADLRLSAGRAADASTALVIVGGVSTAVGLIVLLTTPSSRATTTGSLRRLELAPMVGPGTAAFSLRGRW